ncbi:MAG: response regulator [Betaproteobacteria bacterium]|nr:response regulator [Betaproteobacteria bacterium]
MFGLTVPVGARGVNSLVSGETMSDASVASILVVDDDKRSLLAVQELLRGPGRNLVLAKSGEEALRCMLKDDFAVILLDVRMPGLDGFQTAKLIRERERSRYTPIIFLTGVSEDVDSIFRGYQAGAVDYIVKPLVPEVLKSKISVFVELYAKNAALIGEIAGRKQTEQRLRESEEKLRALAVHLQTVREEEQIRISREIHDQLGQTLTGLKMDLTWLAGRLPADQGPLKEKTESMFGLIDNTIHSVRRIASGMRPEALDEAGLAAAIGWQARDFQLRTGIRCKVDLPQDSNGLDPDRATAVFRIFQEVLTNVARHANATRVDVAMRLDADRLALEVRDNGKGIPGADIHSPKSLGLLGMRERALPFDGRIEISSAPGEGTQVMVSIPLYQDRAPARGIP